MSQLENLLSVEPDDTLAKPTKTFDPVTYLEQELASINNGTQPEMAQLSKSLLKAMEKRIAVADRFRKLHIHNANQLYEYEVAEASASYQRALDDAKERIAGEITSVHKEQLRIMSASRSEDQGTEHAEGTARPSGQGAVRTRRTADKQEVEEAISSWGNGDSKIKCASSNNKRQADKSLSAVLGDTLATEAVRADFVAIVRDMEKRAQKFTESYGKRAELDVNILYGVLSVTEQAGVAPEKFTVGCFVNIFSVLTQEDYTGIVTSITPEEVIIRLGTGTRLRVFVQQIKDRRIVMRMDHDSNRDIETISAAKRIKHA